MNGLTHNNVQIFCFGIMLMDHLVEKKLHQIHQVWELHSPPSLHLYDSLRFYLWIMMVSLSPYWSFYRACKMVQAFEDSLLITFLPFLHPFFSFFLLTSQWWDCEIVRKCYYLWICMQVFSWCLETEEEKIKGNAKISKEFDMIINHGDELIKLHFLHFVCSWWWMLLMVFLLLLPYGITDLYGIIDFLCINWWVYFFRQKIFNLSVIIDND